MPGRARALPVLLALAAVVAAASMPAAGSAAGSNVTVTLAVLSSTAIDPSGCATSGAPGSGNRTAFGTVLPGDEVVTGLDCTITFGSTNDTSRLLLHQRDGTGWAMSQPTDGTLDTDTGDGRHFNTVGHASVSIGSGSEQAKSVAIQAYGATAGGTIVIGHATGPTGSGQGFVARYDAAGARDMSFAGGTGAAWIDTSPGPDEWRLGTVDRRDRTIAVGTSNFATAGSQLLIARFEADGDLDTTFSGGTTPGYDLQSVTGGTDKEWQAVAVDSQDRIVVAGHTDASNNDVVVARFRDDGTLDPTFAGDGLEVFDPVGFDEEIEAIAIDPSGRIVLAGCAKVSTDQDVFAMRLTDAGTIDTSFGTGGWTAVDVSIPDRSDCANGMAMRPDGSMVLSGQGKDASAVNTPIVVGLDADGDLDTTGFFAPTGFATLTIGNGAASFQEAAIAEPDGRVALAGSALDAGSEMDMMAARLNRDGSYDTTFSPGGSDGDGRVIIDHATSRDAQGLAHAHDGSYVLAGEGATNDTGVARLQGSRVQDWTSPAGVDPLNDWTTTQGMFGTCLRAVGGEAGKQAVANTAQWGTPSGSCTVAVATPWRAVPRTAADAASQLATAPAGTTLATAALRFGVRPGPTMRGSYSAPVTFEVLAP